MRTRRAASCSAARALCLRSLEWSLPLWRQSPSRGAHGAAACGAALALLSPVFVVPPHSRRRGARPLHFRGGGTLSRRSASCSAARALCLRSLEWSLPLWRQSPSHGAHGAAASGTALVLLAPALSCRRTRGGVPLGRHSSVAAARSLGAVLRARQLAPLRVVVGAVAFSLEAVAVAQRPRRRYLRRYAGAPGAGSVVPPRSRRRGARPPFFRAGGSFSARCRVLGRLRSLRVVVGTVASCWGRSPSCGAHGVAARGAALMLLAPAKSCRRARGGVTLGRRSSAAAARSLGLVCRAQQLALPKCGRWCGRFPSGGDRRHTALTATWPAAPRWRFWGWLCRAAALAAAWSSAATLPWRRFTLSAWCTVFSGSRCCM